MTANIASKNLFDLLGNDPELDPDREPEPPTKAIDKPVQRSGKRNEAAPRDNARAPAAGRGGRNGEQDAPANNPREEGFRPDRMREPRGERGDRRGGRGGRGGRGRGEGRGGEHRGNRSGRDDRQDHSGLKEHEKQAAHGWGETTGEGEYNDEKAGDAIAQAEISNDAGFTPDTGSGDPAFTNGPDAPTKAEDVAAPEEPEDNTKSYQEYLTDLAEKRKALSGNTTEIRKANEGSKQKFPEGTAFQRNPENEMFFAPSGGKTKKQKEVKEKERVELEGQYYAPVAQEGGRGGRGGRGGSRGDRGGDRGGRGGDRGDRGDRRGGRGRGESRGGFRGDRGGDRADRGGAPRGGARGGFNAQDESAFPALGGN